MAIDISKMRSVKRFPKDRIGAAHAALQSLEATAREKNVAAASQFMTDHGVAKLCFELEGGGDEEQVFFRDARDTFGKEIPGVSPDFPAVAAQMTWDGDEVVVGEIDSAWGGRTELALLVQEHIERAFGGWGTNDGYSGFAEMSSRGEISYDLDPNPHAEEDAYDW